MSTDRWIIVGLPCGQVRGDSQASRSFNRARCSSAERVCPALTAIRLQTRPAKPGFDLRLQGGFVLFKILDHGAQRGGGVRPGKQGRDGTHLE